MAMDLLGRLAAVIGISLALTLLLLVLYQDDGAQAQSIPQMPEATTAAAHGTP